MVGIGGSNSSMPAKVELSSECGSQFEPSDNSNQATPGKGGVEVAPSIKTTDERMGKIWSENPEDTEQAPTPFRP